MGSQESLAHQFEALPPYLGCARNPSKRMDFRKLIQALGVNAGPTASSPTNYPSHTTVTTFRGPGLVLCRFPDCQFVVSELPLVQVRCFTFNSSFQPLWVACTISFVFTIISCSSLLGAGTVTLTVTLRLNVVSNMCKFCKDSKWLGWDFSLLKCTIIVYSLQWSHRI